MPVCRSREPTNPNFQSVERAAADEDGRLGVGRLGGSISTMFRHVKNLPYGTSALRAIWSATDLAGENDAMASVVRKRRTSTPSASTTTAIVVSGLSLVEHVGEHDAKVRGARVAHDGSEVVGDRSWRRACPPPPAPPGRGCR